MGLFALFHYFIQVLSIITFFQTCDVHSRLHHKSSLYTLQKGFSYSVFLSCFPVQLYKHS